MNASFNLRRLYLLINRQWLENRKSYGFFFLAVCIFLIGWFSFFLMIDKPSLLDSSNQLSLYFSGLFIAGCLSANFLFQDFSAKPRKFNYLLLPASALEKLLCVLFYGVVIFFILYTLIFYITDFFVINAASKIYSVDWQKKHGMGEPYIHLKHINVFSLSSEMYFFYPGDNVDLFTAFFPIQSAFILGAVYFKKNGFFKTLVVLLSIWILFVVLESKILARTMPPDARAFKSFTAYMIADNDGNDRIVSLPYWISDVVLFAVRYALTPALWAVTYFRLKEKEI